MAPNSSALPKRLAGICAACALRMSATSLPLLLATALWVEARRSVSNFPGNSELMVTPWPAMPERARPATKPVRPLRAPLDRPRMSIGAFTALDVMLTMRPKPRAAMPSTTVLISSMGVSMLASTALIQASRSQSRKSPVGGPPALVTSMSNAMPGPPATLNTASRPAGVVMSQATASTCAGCLPPVLTASALIALNCAAASCKAASPRALMTTFTPSCTRALAQP